MSETSRSQAHLQDGAPAGSAAAAGTRGAGVRRTALGVSELVQAALPLIAAWLPTQRWYAAPRSRPPRRPSPSRTP
ncbi:hypothetical protein ACIQOV_00385, partial [Kitasatospora sp. NPDC091257]